MTPKPRFPMDSMGGLPMAAGKMPAPGGNIPALPRKKPNWTILHNKFPPTPRVGLVWPRPHRPALILLFAKKFFPVVAGIGDPGGRDHRSRLQPNEVDRTNILAPG